MTNSIYQRKGAYRRTVKGNVDDWYGGGEEAYSSISAACAYVPENEIRIGKIVGIIENGKIVEYIWHPTDITNTGLVKFGGSINDETISSLETYSSQKLESTFAKLPDGLLTKINATPRDGNGNIIISDALGGFIIKARFDLIIYSEVSPKTINIPDASVGFKRSDLVIFTPIDGIILVEGIEDANVPVPPTINYQHIVLFPIRVDGNNVEPPAPAPPQDLSSFLTKSDASNLYTKKLLGTYYGNGGYFYPENGNIRIRNNPVTNIIGGVSILVPRSITSGSVVTLEGFIRKWDNNAIPHSIKFILDFYVYRPSTSPYKTVWLTPDISWNNEYTPLNNIPVSFGNTGYTDTSYSTNTLGVIQIGDANTNWNANEIDFLIEKITINNQIVSDEHSKGWSIVKSTTLIGPADTFTTTFKNKGSVIDDGASALNKLYSSFKINSSFHPLENQRLRTTDIVTFEKLKVDKTLGQQTVATFLELIAKVDTSPNTQFKYTVSGRSPNLTSEPSGKDIALYLPENGGDLISRFNEATNAQAINGVVDLNPYYSQYLTPQNWAYIKTQPIDLTGGLTLNGNALALTSDLNSYAKLNSVNNFTGDQTSNLAFRGTQLQITKFGDDVKNQCSFLWSDRFHDGNLSFTTVNNSGEFFDAYTVNRLSKVFDYKVRPTLNGSQLALISEIPTNNNQLFNGSNYVNQTALQSQLDTKVNKLASYPNDDLIYGQSYNGSAIGYKVASGSGLIVGIDYIPNTIQLIGQLNSKEPTITKNTAFNKNFGTTAGTVADGGATQTALDLKAPLTGTGATGTWGIDISGNAATATNSTQWANFEYDNSTYVTNPFIGLLQNNVTGKMQPARSVDFQSFLGLGTNAYTSTAYYLASNPSGYINSAALSPYQLSSGLGTASTKSESTWMYSRVASKGSGQNANSYYDGTSSISYMDGGNFPSTAVNYPSSSMNQYGVLTTFDGLLEAGLAFQLFSGSYGAKNPLFFRAGSNTWREAVFKDDLGSAAYLNANTNPLNGDIVQRTADGDISARYYSMTGGVGGILSDFTGTNGSDGYIRRYSIGTVQSTLGLGSAAYENFNSRTNWLSTTMNNNVVAQLSWKNYGNSHTIFDASNSTSPDGTSISNTNSQVAWAGTYPTLMGWNGASTFGVRVDSARLADSSSNSTNSTQWAGQTYSGSDTGVNTYLMAYQGGSTFGVASQSGVRTFLGLGSSAYLNVSQLTATANSVVQRDGGGNIYIGYTNSNNGIADEAGFNNFIAQDSGGWIRKYSQVSFRTALGLGASAFTSETLGSVANRNSITDKAIQINGNGASGGTYGNGMIMFFEPSYGTGGSGVIAGYDYALNVPRNLILNPNGGRVGIRTSTPMTDLDVNGTGNFGALLTGTSASFSGSLASSAVAAFQLKNGTSLRWELDRETTESGSNAGSNFQLYRYDDSGNYLGTSFGINRSTGNISLGGALTGTSATFNGNVLVNNISTVNGGGTATFDNFTNYGSALSINSAGGLPLLLKNNGTIAISILGGNTTLTGALTGTSATFSGLVNVNAGIQVNSGDITLSGYSFPKITLFGNQVGAKSYSITSAINGISNTGFSIYNNTNLTTPFYIDGSDNSFFSGALTAPTFVGALNGNAATSTLSTNSTLWNGVPIVNTILDTGYATEAIYIKLGATVYPMYVGGIRNFLGLGSNAYNSTAYLPLTGGTLSGLLSTSATEAFHVNSDAGYMAFWNTGGTSRTGYIQFNAGGSIDLSAESATNGIKFKTGLSGVTRYNIDNNGNHNFASGTATFGGALNGTSATFGGNLGVGETISSTPNNLAIQMVQGTSIQSRAAVPQLSLAVNTVGDWYAATYKTTGNYSSRIVLDGANSGGIQFAVAQPGTAGNTISYTSALTLAPNLSATFGGALNGTSASFSGGFSAASTTGGLSRFYGDLRVENNKLTTLTGDLVVQGSLTGTSASFSSSVTASIFNGSLDSNGDFAIRNIQSGSSLNWIGRIGSINNAANRAIFMGTYNGNSILAAHNSALSNWADLYINTVTGGNTGFNIYLGGLVTVAGALTGTSATFGGALTAPTFIGSLSGNATTATNIANNTFILGSGSVTNSAAIGMYLNSNDVNYWIGKRAGTWTQSMDVSFYTGIKYHSHRSYNGHRFFVEGYDTTEGFSVGKGDNNTRVNYNLYVDGALTGASASFSANSAYLSNNILTVKGGGSGGAFGFSVQANNGANILSTNNLTYETILGGALIGTSATFSSSVDITGTGNVLTLRKGNNVPGIAFAGAGGTISGIDGNGSTLNFYGSNSTAGLSITNTSVLVNVPLNGTSATFSGKVNLGGISGAERLRVEDGSGDSMIRLNQTASTYSSTLVYGTVAATAAGFDFIGMYRQGVPKFNVNYNGDVLSTGTINGSRIISGYDSGQVNSVNASNWFRSNGSTGWYNFTYDGGIHMTDSTWVRVYNNKAFWVDNEVQANRFVVNSNGYKSITYHGMSGDYDQNGTTDKIIWTIGDNWNTIATMYGLGYTYNSIAGYGHSLFMANSGVKNIQFSLETGSATFSGTLSSSNFVGNLSGNATSASSAPNAGNLNGSYGVVAGDGNGIKFWNGSDSYKISMGTGSLYQYGAVTDYSLKLQMDAIAGRGVTIGTVGVAPVIGFNSNNGNATFAGSVTANGFYDSSDARFKTLTNLKVDTNSIKGVSYRWNDGRDDLNHYGYLAQEVQKVMPWAVNTDNKGFLSVRYNEVFAAKIDNLELWKDEKDIEIEKLKKRIIKLEKRINSLNK